MTQILLGQSYFLRFDPKLWDAMQPYPPLGTLYAASYLRQHGYEVALFDAMLAESEEEWAKALDEHQPQYAILYEDNFNYLSKMCLLRMREAAFTMIQMAKARGCTVILCGADATDHYQAYLAKGADYVLIGEGEETLIELLPDLAKGQDPSQILGLATADTQLVRRRPDIADLNKLPFPAWDLVDVEKYRTIWLQRHGYFSMNMVTTRGCPFHCNWCAKPIWGHAQGSLIPFKCLSRADLLTRAGEVDALARAGAQTVWMGAESGSQKILDAMDKGTRVEQIHEAARRLKHAGIRVGFFLQFGYPGETREDIEKTIQLVRDCDPDDIGISVSYPMPGTTFYEAVREQLGEKQNWQDSQDLAMLYQGPFATAFYRKLHSVVHKEFRARKAWKSLIRASRTDLNHGVTHLSWRTVPGETQRLKKLRAPVSQWLRLGYNLLTWPIARIQLHRLASSQNRGFDVPHMPHEAAATPTPQDER
jgi:anaerobic magnesium-protoporphyrin IX monomethyl ester cyclase